ncbi:uncharacterized protein LOC122036193 [Zingiber officinale]|uniref:uncharacterized protein LOC122036193 n=1 Tax=Zingiber officinale TaxID=94328 RepID=UPI001C4D0BFF|nr:uncharacterized protein LOC122036193 [Zingiber officinale]
MNDRGLSLFSIFVPFFSAEKEKDNVDGFPSSSWMPLSTFTSPLCSKPSSGIAQAQLVVSMEGHDEIRDWEILFGSDSVEDSKPLRSSSADESDDGAIKFDYFGIDSGKRYHKGAGFVDDAHEEDAQVDSDNPSWIDPESDSRCDDHDRTKGEVSFPGIRSDESLVCSEKWWADAEEDVKVVDAEGIREIQAISAVNEDLAQEEPDENVKIHISSGDSEGKSVGLDKALADGEEKRGTVWWKFPFQLLKLCAFNVKPVWSISIAAAAILGVMMLGKRLYRMKEKTRSIPLGIILDEKKASQWKVHAARLNEAFSVMRRAPIIRPSLTSGGLTPWSVASLQ